MATEALALPNDELDRIERATNRSVFGEFWEVARCQSDQLAIATPELRWTYEELNAQAVSVHRTLLRADWHGGGVGVLVSSPAQQIAAMLGVLRAGTHYVVLDPEFPEARLADIVADGAVSTLLTDPSLAEQATRLLGDRGKIVQWTGPEGLGDADEPAMAASCGGDLAYVAYTSGSTGKPKGVMHSHANLLHEVAVHRRMLALQADDRSGLLYSPSVIGSVRDIFGMLLSGGAVCAFPFKRKGFAALKAWLRAEQVTQLHAVPVLFRELMRAMDEREKLESVRCVFLAGDRVTPDDVALFRAHFRQEARFYTGLGASEANSIYTHWFAEGHDSDERLPTGWPVPHKEVRLVDEARRPAGSGEIGEIAVCSRYLALGYWGNPKLTAEVFGAPDDATGQRIYYTGDFGYWDEAGRLIHAGRRDQQVKINGERIELGAVEKALVELPEIAQAAVRVFNSDGGKPRLCAYVVIDGAETDIARWRQAVSRRLSPSATPATFVRLDALPMTGNGKLDVQALPDPNTAGIEAEPTAERDWTDTEAAVARLWREVLPVGATLDHTTTFEQMGADSLQAVRLAGLVQQHWGMAWPETLDFRSATIPRLAAMVEARDREVSENEFNALEVLARLWKMEAMGRRMAPDLPIYLMAADQPGTPMLWIGRLNEGFVLAEALATQRPIYALPGLSPTREMNGSEIIRIYEKLAEKLVPYLPEEIVAGGYCHDGLHAVDMSRVLMAKGVKVAGFCLPDAPGSPQMLWFLRLLGRTRIKLIGGWQAFGPMFRAVGFRRGTRNILTRFQRKLARSPIRLPSPETAGHTPQGESRPPVPAVPYGYHPLPKEFKGYLVVGYSRTLAPLRLVWPRLGWPVRRPGTARILPMAGGHWSFDWQKNCPRIVKAVADLELETGASPSPPMHHDED